MNDAIYTEITIRGINIFIPMRLDAIPRGLVPDDGPAKNFEWELVLEGGALRMLAHINGSNYRRMLKTIEENNNNVGVVLRGKLRSTQPGEALVLESAGFDVRVKKSAPFGREARFSRRNLSPAEPVSEAGTNFREKKSADCLPPTQASPPGRRVFIPTPIAKGDRRRKE
jgi:hypothetical protein